MTTKLGRVITSLEWLLSLYSADLLITWPCLIKRQIKKIVSDTAIPMATKLGWVVTYHEEIQLINYLVLQFHASVRSRDILYNLYLKLN